MQGPVNLCRSLWLFERGRAMCYLLPTEYVQYGLAAETADDWVMMASSLMETYCRRPSVLVRYARPRRGELPDFFHEQIAWAFSIPGSWNSLDVTTVDVNQTTAELTFPVSFLGLDYNEVEVTYTSGVVTIPDAVKVACVQIVKNAQATPGTNVQT